MNIGKIFIYLVATPVFISIGTDLSLSTSRMPAQFEDRTFIATFSTGIFSMVYFSKMIKNKLNSKILLVILISFLTGILGAALASRPQALLTLQFWIFLFAVSKYLENFKYDEIRSMSLNISYILFIFQLAALVNGLTGNFATVVQDFIVIYNYEQYYSYAVILGLYIAAYFKLNKIFLMLYYIIALLGSIDSENISATYLIIMLPVIMIIQLLIRGYKFSDGFKFILSLFSALIVIILPLYYVFIYNFYPAIFNEEELGGRAGVYLSYLNNFNPLDLILPKMYLMPIERDPHNTFLNLAYAYSYFGAIILIYSLFKILKKLNLQELIFFAPFIAVTLTLNEPLQHQYTAYLFAMFMAIMLRLNRVHDNTFF